MRHETVLEQFLVLSTLRIVQSWVIVFLRVPLSPTPSWNVVLAIVSITVVEQNLMVLITTFNY